MRAIVERYLEADCAEPRGEIEARRRGTERDAGAPEVELIRERAPQRRRLLYERMAAIDDAAAAARREIRRRRDRAAREAGAADGWSFAAAALAADPRRWLEPFERIAVAPLDAAVREAMRRRWQSSSLPRRATPHAADVPAIAGLADHEDRVSRQAIERTLDRVLDAAGPAGCEVLREANGAAAWPRLVPTAPRPTLRAGAIAGPLGLARALGEMGAGLRLAFCMRRAGPRAHFADPAFAVAARTLFGGIALQPAFEAWSGIELDDELRRALRLEVSLAPRRAWAYLWIGSRGAGSEEPDTRMTCEMLERATQRPVPAGDIAAGAEARPDSADELRGTVLGLLVEERLLVRHGRRWIEQRAALRLLSEVWEAEPDETAESMASALDVGTIEPTPILDRCRP